MAVRNLYDATARLMDGSTVVGYQLKSTEGTPKNVTREQACYLIGKGSIQNVKGAISNGDIILQGVGIRLDALPVIKVKDPKKKETSSSEPVKEPVKEPIKESVKEPIEKVEKLKEQDKVPPINKEAISANYYTNGNRQQVLDYLIPHSINELWENLAIKDKTLFKVVRLAMVELDKKLNESMLISCTKAVDTTLLPGFPVAARIGFWTMLFSDIGFIPAYVAVTVTSEGGFEAGMTHAYPSSDGAEWKVPYPYRVNINLNTTPEQINSQISNSINKGPVKLLKWSKTSAQRICMTVNAAPLVSLVEIPTSNESKQVKKETPINAESTVASTVGAVPKTTKATEANKDTFKDWFSKYYYNAGSERAFNSYLIDELIGALDAVHMAEETEVAKAVTILISSLIASLNGAAIFRKDESNIKISYNNGNLGVKFTGGLFAVDKVVPFEYDILQKDTGASVRIKLWEPTRRTKHVSGGYTLMSSIEQPNDIAEIIGKVQGKWNIEIVPFNGI